MTRLNYFQFNSSSDSYSSTISETTLKLTAIPSHISPIGAPIPVMVQPKPAAPKAIDAAFSQSEVFAVPLIIAEKLQFADSSQVHQAFQLIIFSLFFVFYTIVSLSLAVVI